MEPTIGVGEMAAVLIVIMLWLGFAILPARFARRKGYNFWLFYFCGLAFLVPTLIIVALLPPNKQQDINIARTGQRLGFGRQQGCTLCGTVNEPNASACVACGMAFASVMSSASAAETMNLSDDLRVEVNEGRTKICRNCGRLNSPSRTTCKTCRAELAA